MQQDKYLDISRVVGWVERRQKAWVLGRREELVLNGHRV